MTNIRSINALSLITLLAIISACSGESATESAAQPESSDNVAAVRDAPAATEPAHAGTKSSAFPTAALIDPNTATGEELAAVPGMSEAAAAAIVSGRPFTTPAELDAAIGDTLDDAARKSVYARVFIKVGLNSGAEDDYKLIPSTMPAGKLAHEFEEYRPYESMDQFSREMSKYVSEEEVAYLGRFVTLD
jgi:hypothetical protein